MIVQITFGVILLGLGLIAFFNAPILMNKKQRMIKGKKEAGTWTMATGVIVIAMAFAEQYAVFPEQGFVPVYLIAVSISIGRLFWLIAHRNH